MIKNTHWDQLPLKDLLDFYIGGDWGKDLGFEDTSYGIALCIRGSEIKNWEKDKGKTASLRKIKLSNIEKRRLIEGDILVEISGGGPEQPVGRTVVIDKPALSFNPEVPKICTNFLRLIRPKKAVNSKFLNYYLKFFYQSGEIVKYQAGSNNLRNLKFPDYLKIKVPCPNSLLQDKIVDRIEEVFSELDKGVEQLETLQQQLKVYRQSVLNHAFEGKLTEEWRLVNPRLQTAEELLEEIKSERERQANKQKKKLKMVDPLSEKDLKRLPALPNTFIWGKIAYLTIGVEYGSSQKSLSEGKIPVLRMGNIQNHKFDWDDLVFTNDEAEIEKYKLKSDDVLFNRTNSPELVGKTALYRNERPAIFAGYLIRLNQISSIVSAKYLCYFLNSHLAKVHGNTVKTDGVNQSNINGEKLINYPFPFTSLEEQNQIVLEIESRLSVCDKLEETIQNSLKQAKALRQSILQKAFTGQLVLEKQNSQESKVVSIINEDSSNDWHRKVLAGKIISICYKDKNFGHTKFQKVLYLCEQHAQLDFNSSYIKQTAGPFDTNFYFPFLLEAQENDWVIEKPMANIIFFKPSSNINSLVAPYSEFFEHVDEKIIFIINQLKNRNTRESELVATIYAIWNNLLLDRLELTPERLIEEVYIWSESKNKFSKEEILKTWQDMKENELIPSGFGKKIEKKI